jgi:hypothetical protein
MKKLMYLLLIAVGLAASVAADGPWPDPCAPNCVTIR